MRDNYKCKECGKINVKLEVHHIIPRRLYGSTTLDNLISLCINCHNKTKGIEEQYINKYKNIILILLLRIWEQNYMPILVVIKIYQEVRQSRFFKKLLNYQKLLHFSNLMIICGKIPRNIFVFLW